MAAVRFRRLRVWWMRQHSYSRLWPFCWDCRLAQKAWAKGEFYAHDDPQWYVDELMATAEPAKLVEPPRTTYQLIDGVSQTYTSGAASWTDLRTSYTERGGINGG